MNPFYFVQNEELHDIKADKIPIGGSESERKFQKQSFQIQKSTVVYLFSDGFQDQFGGKQGKKFMAKRFRELLFSISSKPMPEQLVEERLTREIRFDPDAWIVETEDQAGRHFLDLARC